MIFVGKQALSYFDAQVLEPRRRRVVDGLHLEHGLLPREDLQVVPPDVEVAEPLVDGDEGGAALGRQGKRVAPETGGGPVADVQPEGDLGDLSGAVDAARLEGIACSGVEHAREVSHSRRRRLLRFVCGLERVSVVHAAYTGVGQGGVHG